MIIYVLRQILDQLEQVVLEIKYSKLYFLKQFYICRIFCIYREYFFLYFSMNYRESSVKSKLIISLFQTVQLSL